MLDLRRYVPDGRVSTGLIAWRDGRLVWALSQRKYWRQSNRGLIVPLVGIGGGQELDETLPATVAREAREEAATAIALRSAPSTLWVWPDEHRTESCRLAVELVDEPAPALIWQRTVSYIGADGQARPLAYICPVYEADLLDEPHPAGEIPGLLSLSPAETRGLAHGPRSLADLLAVGAHYQGEPLPEGVHLELQGSAIVVAEYWLSGKDS